jgi:pyruvate formate lyase activating enzyme
VATAGYIDQAPLKQLMRHTDAFSVTLKGFTEKFYKEVCGCGLKEVQAALQTIARSKTWVEVVTLVVPGLNDREADLRALARFVARTGKDIPLHFLRFAPAYKLKNLPPTPRRTLEKAHALAVKEGLRYVYIDLSGHRAANTYCPKCGRPVIERAGFTVIRKRLRNGRCAACSYRIPGIF